MDWNLEELSRTLASLDDPIFVLNMDGVFTDGHPAEMSVGGATPVSFSGRHYREVLTRQGSRHVARAFEAIRAGDRFYQFEYCLGADTAPIWWSAKITGRRTTAGLLVGLTMLCRDITATKHEEMRLADLHAKAESGNAPGRSAGVSNLGFRDIFDVKEIQQIQDAFAAATGVASIITDVDGAPITRASNFCHLCEHIIRATPKGRRNCYHSDAIIGRVHPDGPVMQPCLSGGLVDGGTSIMAGDVHIANWLIGQVRDPSVPDEVLLAYADEIGAEKGAYGEALKSVTITSREQFGRVCKALHLIGAQLSTLAYRNVQQARLMAERRKLEEQLRQAQKLEAVGQLAGGVAHDFNNILAIQMLQFSLLAQREDLSPDLREALATLHAGAKSAASLTQQLLAFSRRSILQVETFDLGEHLARMHKLMARMLREDIDLSYERPRHPVLIAADPVMIEQVFMNLVLNARDAIRSRGSIRILLEEDAGLGEACITVSDTGCGMDEATRARVFEPFFTTKEKGSGTGLGLATVYGIVQQHKGSIHVVSVPGQGTDFVVRFPFAPPRKSQSDAGPASAGGPARGQGEIILVVEDEAQVRSILVRSLKHLGYVPLETADASEALAVWEQKHHEIRAVITDMVMPGTMNGAELARRLLGEKRELKVIIASGYSSDLAAHGAPPEAGISYLQKPYELTKLATVLAELLR